MTNSRNCSVLQFAQCQTQPTAICIASFNPDIVMQAFDAAKLPIVIRVRVLGHTNAAIMMMGGKVAL
jgi:hypothetical protein